MISGIASFFRTLNTQLLYSRGPIQYLLKGAYGISVLAFNNWRRTRRPPRVVTINNFDKNLRIQVDVSKAMGAALFWTGFHEFNEMRFLNRFLRPDMNFLDVGANQGEFSLFVAKRLTKGRVLAFEPMSFFFNRLVYNIGLNNFTNIRAYKVGLSDRSEQVPIYFNTGNEVNHEGLASIYPLNQNHEGREVISLETLDHLVARESLGRIDFIKIDVEGSEWAVLKGAVNILKKYKPALMVELNDQTAAMAGFQVDDMIAWLRSMGYAPYQISKQRLDPLKVRPAFCNAVFQAS